MSTKANPLRRGKSREVIGDNISKLMHEGYPQKQAVAIALKKSREGRRYASNPSGPVHDDVEFAVEDLAGSEHVFKSFAEAAGFAVAIAATGIQGGVPLDVLVWSEEGAAALAGDDGVERYLEDPEASVFERLQISVDNLGRIA